MNQLSNKNILIGITGSIAAYKAAELTRLLRSCGANVNIVMTKDATEFISELTLQALSSQPVYKNLLDPQSEASMSHITLAKWADLLLITPATANIMAKFAAGLADDLLSTLYLATSAPTLMAPAMNQQMWQHPTTINNKLQLEQRGVLFLGPASGQQACGDVGPGRMLEPEDIVAALAHYCSPKILQDIKILITAGPTHEPIDPVRYISNHSSGKMGYALAEAAVEFGANVTLISGPTNLTTSAKINRINVHTAQEMYAAVMTHIASQQLFIACAAVADYRCEVVAQQKIKKSNTLTLKLVKNEDILLAVSRQTVRPFLVGFAAETENLYAHALEKFQQKQLDIIIANQVGSEESGFTSDHNKVLLMTKDQTQEFPLMPKKQLARDLLLLIYQQYANSK